MQPRALREGHPRDLPELRLDPGGGGQRPGPGRQLCHPSRLLPIRSGIHRKKKVREFSVPSRDVTTCPASQVKKNQAHLLNREPLSWSCVSDLLLLIRRELLRAVTLDDSTPQCRISELRVWSYEPLIVSAPSSSG